MARSLEPLVVGKVIGDVVDMFSPAVEFTVRYGAKQVSNGCEIKPSATADHPKAQILGPPNPSNLYTLVFVPFGPFRIVVDIPEGLDATKGKEVVAYMGPKPPTGIHRYVLVLFRQRNGTRLAGSVPSPEVRSNFSTRRFAAQYDLGLPVAAVYFNSQKEPATRKR
ncbi:hypothetical protein TIFTF001_020090 [Ficus carica]|uniref:Uncharacterized protein n=1 Tax=Ficus carica TaxID=3494 RepID=A0AA88AXI9_FICCA|nr:hypothetical protein TIFTF001_020090 [Ficus carica]